MQNWYSVSAVFAAARGKNAGSYSIFLAGIFMFGSNVKFIAPPMLCASFFTSLSLGSFAENFCRKSVWFNELVLKSPVKIDSTFSEIEKVNFFYVFLSAIGFSVLTFRNSVFELYFVVVLFVFLGFIKKRTLKIFPSVLLIFFIVFFSLFSPHGKILFSFGKLNITLGALNLGLAKAGRLWSSLPQRSFCPLPAGRSRPAPG